MERSYPVEPPHAGSSKASVKKSSSILKLSGKLLGASQDVQIVDNSAAQIEEVLAHTSIASTAALPSAHVGKGMLDGHPFAQLGTSLRRLLTLAQLDEQGFIGMEAHTPPLGTGSALGLQGTLGAGVFGKWMIPPDTKGISCSAGQRMICFSQSRAKACLEKRLLSRTG